jgi:hypothetical protein
MKAIDVSGIPGPIADALATLVEEVRVQLVCPPHALEAAPELPNWQGSVIGNLTREEIYDDVA